MANGVLTLEEIHGQPTAWRNTFDTMRAGALAKALEGASPLEAEWVFIGCGTSFYLAQAAAASVAIQLGVGTRAYPASELLFYPDAVLAGSGKPVLPVLISRSGMTSEIVRAANLLRERGVAFLGVTCDGGDLETLSPNTLCLPVPEKSTVMTASFTSMLLALQHLAAGFGWRQEELAAFDLLPAAAGQFLANNNARLQALANRAFDNYIFLGQGPLFGVAQECALKVTESSCSYTQSFHTLEFRHGPKSIIVPEVLTAFLISETGYEEELEVVSEMKELGATTLAVANRITPELKAASDYAFELQMGVPEVLRSAGFALVGQLLGSYVGLRKGLNPDSPRNLTRVVMLQG